MNTRLHIILSIFKSPAAVVSSAVVVIALAFIDPFDLARFSGPAGRVLYWAMSVAIALVLAGLFRLFLPALYARVGLIGARLLSGAAFAVLMAPILFILNFIMFPERLPELTPMSALIPLLFFIFAGVALICDAVSYQFTGRPVGWEVGDPVLPTALGMEDAALAILPAKEEPEAEDGPPRFFARLKPQLGTDLVRLEMQDHYVEAHTKEGSQLILMRLSDAVAELKGVDGLQVHRSHWVARDAVTGSKRADGKIRLLMSDGSEVPVSRGRAKEAREAGYLT